MSGHEYHVRVSIFETCAIEGDQRNTTFSVSGTREYIWGELESYFDELTRAGCEIHQVTVISSDTTLPLVPEEK